MAQLQIFNIGNVGFQWNISSLSNNFNTSFYIQAGVGAGTQADGLTTTPPSLWDTVAAPSSGGSTTSTTKTSPSIFSPGTSYYGYGWVQAANGQWFGCGSTSFTMKPDPLSGLTATGFNTYVHLSWTASAGATGYNITWSPGAGSATVGAVTTRDILGLTNGTSYTFTVTPTNSGGSGGSQSASATPAATRPSNFAWSVSKTSGGTLTVTAAEWANLASSVNSFRLYKSLSSYSFTSVTANVTDISATIYNEMRTKINDMSPPTTLPAAVTAGTTIAASHFNGLRDSLNSIT